MTETATRPETVTARPEPLRLADRCDQCNAQAFVRVTFGNGADLLFCGHHFHRHEVVLMARHSDLTVQDERDKINHKPTAAVDDD